MKYNKISIYIKSIAIIFITVINTRIKTNILRSTTLDEETATVGLALTATVELTVTVGLTVAMEQTLLTVMPHVVKLKVKPSIGAPQHPI